MSLQKELMEVVSEDSLDELARKSHFIQRTGKITASAFVKTLIFNLADHKSMTLLDLKCDFLNHENCSVSREAIHKRFTPGAVSLLKGVISKLISSHLGFMGHPFVHSCHFSGIYIKDSTKFSLPALFFHSYPGFNTYNNGEKTALMNVQYEYDLLSKNWTRLELTQATRNDQTESKETADEIRTGSLNIRDLGYITSAYLSAIQQKGAYYLNRLPKIGVFILDKGAYKKLDWEAH